MLACLARDFEPQPWVTAVRTLGSYVDRSSGKSPHLRIEAATSIREFPIVAETGPSGSS